MKPARPRRLGFFLPGSIRHWRRVSPSLSFEREDGVVERVHLRGEPWLETGNAALATVQAPSTLVIVGSGPSISTMDMTLLPAGSAMLLNGTISLMPKVQPFAIVIEDRRFVDRHWPMLREALEARPRLLASAEALSAIAEREPKAPIGPVWLNDNVVKPVGAKRRPPIDLAFSLHPHRATIRGGSVAVMAFQWAVALRPRRIAFAGVELWNANEPRFYEGDDMAKSGIVRAQKRILRHLDAGTQIAREAGIKVVNLSPGSALGTIGIETVPLEALASPV